MKGVRLCFSQCRDFKCTKRSLKNQGRNSWCTWTNELCDPKKCNYAICSKRQLLDNGICGFSIKRKTRESFGPEDMFQDEIRVRGKLIRKTGEKKIF